MCAEIVPGCIFPNYELPDHTSNLRKLSDLQGEDPVIPTLARGHYCTKEHQQHLELAAFYPNIAGRTLRSRRLPPNDHHLKRRFGCRPIDSPCAR